MGLVLELLTIGVKTALAPVTLPIMACQAICEAIDSLDKPPEDNWDPSSRVVGYEERDWGSEQD